MAARFIYHANHFKLILNLFKLISFIIIILLGWNKPLLLISILHINSDININ